MRWIMRRWRRMRKDRAMTPERVSSRARAAQDQAAQIKAQKLTSRDLLVQQQAAAAAEVNVQLVKSLMIVLLPR